MFYYISCYKPIKLIKFYGITRYANKSGVRIFFKSIFTFIYLIFQCKTKHKISLIQFMHTFITDRNSWEKIIPLYVDLSLARAHIQKTGWRSSKGHRGLFTALYLISCGVTNKYYCVHPFCLSLMRVRQPSRERKNHQPMEDT